LIKSGTELAEDLPEEEEKRDQSDNNKVKGHNQG